MTPETDATAWPYALTLTTTDGNRRFRFRVDPVPESLPFGRIGEPSGCRPPVDPGPMVGMIVAERELPPSASRAWTMPTWADVAAIGFAAKDAGLGRLGALPSSYYMPPRWFVASPLAVTGVAWDRFDGRARLRQLADQLTDGYEEPTVADLNEFDEDDDRREESARQAGECPG